MHTPKLLHFLAPALPKDHQNAAAPAVPQAVATTSSERSQPRPASNYQQLAAGRSKLKSAANISYSADPPVRDPIAYPKAPLRHQGAAWPIVHLGDETTGLHADARHRALERFSRESNTTWRARLSPTQRFTALRAEQARASRATAGEASRPASVTYSVNSRG